MRELALGNRLELRGCIPRDEGGEELVCALRGTHIACVYMATYVFTEEEEESGYEWITIG